MLRKGRFRGLVESQVARVLCLGALLVGSSFVGAGCLSAGLATSMRSVQTDDWSEVETAHFHVYGSIRPSELAQLARQFEQEYVAVEEGLFHQKIPGQLRMRVVVLQSVDQLAAIRAEKGHRGLSLTNLRGDMEPEPTLAFYGSAESTTLARFRHELTQILLESMLSGIPPWLIEGMAIYQEATHVEGNEVVVGGDLQDRKLWPGDKIFRKPNGSTEQLQVPIAWLIPFDKLRRMRREDFEVTYQNNRDASDAQDDRVVAQTSAWHAVHTLLTGPPEIQQAFSQALFEATQAGTMSDAMNRLFDNVGVKTLNDALYKHAWRTHTTSWRGPIAIPEVGSLEPTLVGELDAAILLLGISHPASTTAADAVVRIRTYADRGDPKALLHFAMIKLEADKRVAMQLLSDAHQRVPADVDICEGLVRVAMLVQPDGPLESNPDIESCLGILEKGSSTAGHLRTLASYQLRAGNLAPAAELANRAVEISPYDAYSLEVLAQIVFELGDARQAYQIQSLALARLDERFRIPRVKAARQRMDAYELKSRGGQ